MSIKIQYVSDIHLETHFNTSKSIFEKILKPSAPYLALCGDIGYPGSQLYEPFLQYCSENFEHIFYIPGNHEYYNDTKSIKFIRNKHLIQNDPEMLKKLSLQFACDSIEERSHKIKTLCSKYPNIQYLDKDTFNIPDTDIVLVGCTLWSKLNMNPIKLPSFNDFHRICEDPDTTLMPNTYNNLNAEHIEFIKTTLLQLNKESPEKRIVMLTHHCPTYDIIVDEYRLDDPDNTNSFFANKDLISPFGKNVKAWICGHTHGCKTIDINGTIVATNTFGYEHETIEGFKNDAILEI
jgi:hypothetical protein